MRAMFTIPIAALALLAFSVSPAAATTITYDFSGTLGHGPASDTGNTSVTGQFTIDFDTQSITAFHFVTPVIDVDSSGWTPVLRTYTPASLPADDFVQLSFQAGPISSLTLLFQTTLAAFDGSAFYPHFILSTPSQSVGSGLVCQESAFTACAGFFGAPFVSGAATPHTDPSPTVPEPASLTLIGSGLLMLARRRRGRGMAAEA
jgi:PEP-CTERM motif